jgi:AAA family ATP:ADP antiporter
MSDRLFALHGNESGEKSVLSLLLVQSVFLGFFLGSFDVTAHSVFLSVFDEKMMARGYVVSGLAGIFLTSLYYWLRLRISFKNLALLNLSFVTALTLWLWLALVFSPVKWVIFIVFVMLGPLNILVMMGFRDMQGNLISSEQERRSSGLIETGLIVGIIIICYIIPLLLALNLKTQNILLISASSIFVATIIQISTGNRLRPVNKEKENYSDEPVPKKSVFNKFVENRHIGTMGIFIALSIITLFFVQYTFMAVTREQYPAAKDMAEFLGIFTGSMMILVLLVKLFVFSYLLHNYGLRTCLVLSPVLLLIFTGIAVTTGMFLGYSPGSGIGFILFFVFLALSRLFSRSLKESVESSSLKIISLAVDDKERNGVMMVKSGTVNEIAALLSGLILSGIGLLSFIRLIHFSFILFFIVLLWIFAGLKLYSEYREKIRKALGKDEEIKPSVNETRQVSVLKKRFAASMAFRGDYFSLISGDFSVLNIDRGKLYFEELFTFCVNNRDNNLEPALKKITGNSDLAEEIRKKSEGIISILKESTNVTKTEVDKTDHARSLLAGIRMPQTTEILRLLRDNSVESKRNAIYMIGKFKISDMLPEVCECLNIPGLEKDTFAVLSSFRDEAVSELIRYYLVSSGNENISRTILRLLGKACTAESRGFLFSRIWSNSRFLKEEALWRLNDCGFKPSGEERDRLFRLISDTIGLMTWNLSAKICLEKNDDTFLLGVMKNEMVRWKKFLFKILSITYEPEAIKKIWEKLENGSLESVSYALEIIDLIIDDSIKPYLTLLFDYVSDSRKAGNLYRFFPGQIPQYDSLLEDIINRDYNLLSLWTKACTLRNIPEIEGDKLKESVVALFFSPETILQEEAARLVARSDMELYELVSQRIPDLIRRRLDNIVYGKTEEMELLFEKTVFLSDIFKGINEEDLLILSEEIRFKKDISSGLKTFTGGSVIWPLSADKQHDKGYIYYNEDITDNNMITDIASDTPCYVLSLKSVEEFNDHFPDKSFEILKYIDDHEIF